MSFARMSVLSRKPCCTSWLLFGVMELYLGIMLHLRTIICRQLGTVLWHLNSLKQSCPIFVLSATAWLGALQISFVFNRCSLWHTLCWVSPDRVFAQGVTVSNFSDPVAGKPSYAGLLRTSTVTNRISRDPPEMGFYKLRPANKTDDLCQSWQ